MDFIDSHCHFDFSAFELDREAIWRTCHSLGVKQLIIPGVTPSQWQSAAALSASLQGVSYAVGLHPWWSKDFVGASWLRTHLSSAACMAGCVAIGECGLDAAIDAPLAVQQEILDVHLQVAAETELPVIIHCRKAHNEILIALKGHKLPRGGVIHAFSGSIDLARQYWALGFALGIGGTITYPRASKTRAAVQLMSLAGLLLETDAQDMPLSGQQGERNSPTNIVQIAQVLADIRGESLASVAQQTTLNARNLFNLTR